MKKILIVIHDMRIGGAQKSLLSFLQALAADERASAYEVQVLPLNPRGEFMTQIPDGVKVIFPDHTLSWVGQHAGKELLLRHFSFRGLIGETVWIIRKALKLFPKQLNGTQRIWTNWRKLIPVREEKYDIAIGYMDGTPSYYVMDKVQADKKVMWLHSDYDKQGYAPSFDAAYYEKSDTVITISDACKAAIERAHPSCKAKMHVLENISAYSLIREQSEVEGAPEFDDAQCPHILTVGRLHPQKGIDLAVDAARCLKEKGFSFRWLVAGEGSERTALEHKINEYGLENHIFLLGSRRNPYVYMKKCDILVQPSRVEGKSIVLDEAKMLCKPMVVTNYPTVADSVTHGENGWVVSMTGEAIAEGIIRLWEDEALRRKLVVSLEAAPKGNEALLNRYIEIML